MSTIGLPLPTLSEEYRIALVPADVAKLPDPSQVKIASGYGELNGFDDHAYSAQGCIIVDNDTAYRQEMIVQPKITPLDYERLPLNRTLLGWMHKASENPELQPLKDLETTVIAWEHMFNGDRHVFHTNNYITGQTAIIHTMPLLAKIPGDLKVAIIGKGIVGTGAYEQLEHSGVANIDVFCNGDVETLKETMGEYDMIVHAARVLPVGTKILGRRDFANMKPGAVFVHTGDNSIELPHTPAAGNHMYYLNGNNNLLWGHSHIPSLVHESASAAISADFAPYLSKLIKNEPCDVLENAILLRDGVPTNLHEF